MKILFGTVTFLALFQMGACIQSLQRRDSVDTRDASPQRSVGIGTKDPLRVSCPHKAIPGEPCKVAGDCCSNICRGGHCSESATRRDIVGSPEVVGRDSVDTRDASPQRSVGRRDDENGPN
ncbi:hypothetical protein Ptr902_01184 [Pyrenophora tritici-repentis]|nr:hypothetical protein Ptr902_01184 [Pyrenophora tritici-repentis]